MRTLLYPLESVVQFHIFNWTQSNLSPKLISKSILLIVLHHHTHLCLTLHRKCWTLTVNERSIEWKRANTFVVVGLLHQSRQISSAIHRSGAPSWNNKKKDFFLCVTMWMWPTRHQIAGCDPSKCHRLNCLIDRFVGLSRFLWAWPFVFLQHSFESIWT